jgi:hypothetical protein
LLAGHNYAILDQFYRSRQALISRPLDRDRHTSSAYKIDLIPGVALLFTVKLRNSLCPFRDITVLPLAMPCIQLLYVISLAT